MGPNRDIDAEIRNALTRCFADLNRPAAGILATLIQAVLMALFCMAVGYGLAVVV